LTHFIYMLWFLSLLALAGEVDRRWGRWVCNRFLPELSTSPPWFWPPIVSLAVPGAGQLLNQQPAKGLLCFLWPFTLVALNRPGRTEALTLWLLIAAWYAVVIAEAGLTSLFRSRHRRPRLRRRAHPTMTDD
jgi:hypothetical protein